MPRKRESIKLTRAAMPSIRKAKNYEAKAKYHAAAAKHHHRLWLRHLAMEAAAKVKRDAAIERALKHRRR